MADGKASYIYPTIETPLDGDAPKFTIKALEGIEALSQPFSYELTLTSLDDKVAFEDLVSQVVTIKMPLPDDKTRYFNGIISDLSQSWSSVGKDSGGDDLATDYKATLVPKLWRCTRGQNSRVFQGMTVPDIAKDVLNKAGIDTIRFDLNSKSYEERDFCVQYNETDLNFISRLLEDEGVYYFFEHTESDHTLVLSDGSVAHAALSGSGEIQSIDFRRELRALGFEQRDYDFSEPGQDLSSKIDSTMPPAIGEVYEYPSGERERFEGGVRISRERLERSIRLRVEEEESRVVRITGTSDRRSFSPGFLFEFVQPSGPATMADKEFLLLKVEHKLSQSAGYQNRFECLEATTTYRSPRITRKPKVEGPQTAVVVGPAGEEKAYTDGHGRVKVKFHWDREATGDDMSSCWIRVSHPWAGSGWGSISIPHVGHEVIVDFLEGNPDRPVITGRVYHESNRTPQEPEDSGNANAFKSINRDHFGNEIVLDATPGDEHIRLFSPHHNSGLTLGRSFSHFSDSDSTAVTHGNKSSYTVGSQITGSLGAKLIAHFGLNAGFTGGGAVGLTLGWKADVVIGPAVSYQWGRKIELGSSSKTSVAKGYNLISGSDEVNLIGGATTTGTMSILNMHDNRFVASVGNNAEQVAATRTQKAAGLVALGAAAAAIGATVGLTVARHGYGEPAAGQEDEFSKRSDNIAIWENAISAICALIVGGGAAYAKTSIKPQTHMDGDKPHSTFVLDDEGNAGLAGTKQVTLMATNNLTNNQPEKDHTNITLSKSGDIDILTQHDDYKAKSNIRMTKDRFDALAGDAMNLEAKTGNITLKAGGTVVITAPGSLKVNGNLVVTN